MLAKEKSLAGSLKLLNESPRSLFVVKLMRLIGPPPASESYLNKDIVLATAIKSGSQALHPGYGFLSENSEVFKLELEVEEFNFEML